MTGSEGKVPRTTVPGDRQGVVQLNREDRLYFIHIPKTAGTTLISLLDARFHVNEICPAQLWRELLRLPQETLPRYRLFRGHFGARGLDPFLPKPPLRLTMLRHPVPLALSTYQFIRREPATHLHQIVRSRRMSFADFVQHPLSRAAVTNKQVENLCFSLHYQAGRGPAIGLVGEADQWVKAHRVRLRSGQERLGYALETLRECVFFGLVERFDESMALLNWTFGWPPVRKVQKLMVAPSRAQPALPEQLIHQIDACNGLDHEIYQEGERLFEARLEAMYEGLARYAKPGESPPRRYGDNPALVHELLDRHYQQCLSNRSGKVSDCVRVTFDGPLPGSGWHRRERTPHDNHYYRWTGPGNVSTLDVPVKGEEDLTVTFLVLDGVSNSVVDDLELEANGQPLPLRRIGRRFGTPVYLQARLPREHRGSSQKRVRLTFQIPQTAPLHSLDNRSVGVAIGWIEICPERKVRSDRELVAALREVKGLRKWVRCALHVPLVAMIGRAYLYLRAWSVR